MTIFVVSICAIWKVSISIDYDMSSTWVVELNGTDGGRTWRTRGARCPLGTRICNRVTWAVSWRKGRCAMDFVTGGGAIDSVTGGGAIDSITGRGASNDIDGWDGGESGGGDGGEKVCIDVTWEKKGKSNDIDGLTGVRVDDMVVSGRDEWASMDTSGGESGNSNDVDGWNRGNVDVTGGCEGCTKVDARGTCRWPTWRPPFPRPLMGGTLIGVINDGGLMNGPKDVDDSCVECMRWSSPIACKTLILIWRVSSKSFEIVICDTTVIYIRKWNMRHLHVI